MPSENALCIWLRLKLPIKVRSYPSGLTLIFFGPLKLIENNALRPQTAAGVLRSIMRINQLFQRLSSDAVE